MLHVLAVVMISDLCTFCKALSCKSLWIKASAKLVNVNVEGKGEDEGGRMRKEGKGGGG